jgi:toxin ParE1/3/4
MNSKRIYLIYSYYLSSEAKEDLRIIYYYVVSQFGIDQADRYFNMIHDCFYRIEKDPLLFPSAEYIKKKYHFCVCGVDTIYYQINSKERIEIIAIIGRQDFPK